MSLWLTKDDKNVILCQKRMGLPSEILRFAPRNDRNEGGKRTKQNKIRNLPYEMSKKDKAIKNTRSDKKPGLQASEWVKI
jgi:hypothetical protein